MVYDAVDVFGFAGGMTLGMVQSGVHLVGKRELPGGFGVPNCLVNRTLLGDDWDAEVGPPESWTVKSVPIVFGNPPCSGFSVMTDKKHRGMDAKINHCMHSFGEYAGKCRPIIAVFESVRPAFSNGRDLMQRLRVKLEEDTGLKYGLYHVMHNAYDLGGAAFRPRYFWVASQIPFGVNFPEIKQLPVLKDVIGDLAGLAITWQPQPYRREASWWSRSARSDLESVDGHMTRGGLATMRALDLLALAEEKLDGWPENWHIGKVARHVYENLGYLPKSWEHMTEKLVRIDFHMGFTSLTRWDMNRPGRVITGGALNLVLHPTEPRCVTHREAARIMGFPDDWRILPLKNNSGLPLTWGKGITVQCGKWIGEQVINALDGSPGENTGIEIGEREYLIKSTNVAAKSLPRVPTAQRPVTISVDAPKVERIIPQMKEYHIMTEPAETASTTQGRGRPRPEETKARDAKALEIVSAAGTAGVTKEALAAALGVEKPGIAYLSLYRLRKDGLVVKSRSENGGKFVWTRTETPVPA
jgi:DNA (cytosine-5)-methyltransferase 1